MFGHTFYHGTIRRYVVLFGTLFNDLYINVPDTVHNRIKTVKVPITYSARDKLLARVTADPTLSRPAIVLPRMGFEMVDMRYDPSRKLNTIGKKLKQDSVDPNTQKYVYNPVPYNFDFRLYIMVKTTEDGTRIVEQILPFFTPEWTATVSIVPDMDITMDIPVVLTSVSHSDGYEGSVEQDRVITWDLTFTVKGYLFGPISKGGVITLSTTNVFGGLASADPAVTT
ncbi:hypothetical protein EBT25_13285, partial [bacterium]|nr:hypothetical protein [bacterium]